MVLVLLILNLSFSVEFYTPEKVLAAVAGFIALVISASKSVIPGDQKEIRSAIGWLVLSLLALCFVALLKVLLANFWKGGFSAEFSSGFDLAVSTFMGASNKPAAWLRYILFSGAIFAYGAFLRGAIIFVLALLPELRRYQRWFL